MLQKFRLSGTTCQSCEIVIEREVKKLPGVSGVSASYINNTLDIESNQQYSPQDIQDLIGHHGYRVSNQPIAKAIKSKINWKRIGGLLIVVFALYFILNKTGILTFSPSASEPAGWLAVLAIGLVASVSSCTAVVGGLVVAVSSQFAKNQIGQKASSKFRPHAYFNLGRLIGFAVFGAIIGLIGSSIQLSPGLNGLFVLIIAIFMILLGINLLDLFPMSVIRMPKWLAHKIHELSESKKPGAPMLLGALTFFLPCGFTQSMQLYALSLQDPWQASMVMALFALGTLPALIGIGSLTSFASDGLLKKVTKTAGVLVMVLGLSNFMNGAVLLGFDPSAAFAKTENASLSTIADGQQYIQMEITNELEYAPNVLTVKKGVPVQWEIYGPEFLGCANTLVARDLGINTYLHSGFNTIEFTPKKAGKFTFSCSMGMFRGTMIVIE